MDAGQLIKKHRGLKIVALIEVTKGGLVLLAGFGLFALIHENVESLASELIGHLHLNPANKYPHVFLHLASGLTDSKLWFLAVAAVVYSAMRFVEAFGLWMEKKWAEWFGVLTGLVYIPPEIFELAKGVTFLRICVFSVNLVVVAYLGYVLLQTKISK